MSMTRTEILEPLCVAITETLGPNLVGIYLYGSLVFGDFVPDVSDIDLLAAVQHDLTDTEFDRLRTMHANLVTSYPEWDGRIEVAYVSWRVLQTFKHERSPIGIISPGEPLHRIEAGIDWQINWYFVLSHGVTLRGPDPSAIIAPISDEEFLNSSRMMLRDWRTRIPQLRDARGMSYATLTMARSLYTLTNHKHVSKDEAVRWTGEQFPQWRPLLHRALRIRVEPGHDRPDPEAITLAQAFFDFVSGQVDPNSQE